MAIAEVGFEALGIVDLSSQMRYVEVLQLPSQPDRLFTGSVRIQVPPHVLDLLCKQLLEMVQKLRKTACPVQAESGFFAWCL